MPRSEEFLKSAHSNEFPNGICFVIKKNMSIPILPKGAKSSRLHNFIGDVVVVKASAGVFAFAGSNTYFT